MSINPEQFVSWGLWHKGGWSTGKLACSFASWGLETTLPQRIISKGWSILTGLAKSILGG